MKRKIISLYVLLFAAFGYAAAQETITVTANNLEISDNLDLEAVASIFGDSEDLEDFENRLNDPNMQISNLDLNRDGYVDYLRVVELSENYTHLIAIQAVIGNDLYQDVATIEVERDVHGVTTIQVVGDSYIYGPDYIIEPVYVYRPLIVVWFWGPYYRPWYSPYYWGYYPYYYRSWHPYHPHYYRTNVHVHINVHNAYHYTNVRRCGTAVNMHHQVARNDYGSRHPENSFTKRNQGITNRSGLNQHRSSAATNNSNNARPALSDKRNDFKSGEVKKVDYDRKDKASTKQNTGTTRPTPAKQTRAATTYKSDQREQKSNVVKRDVKSKSTPKQREQATRTNNKSSEQKAKNSSQPKSTKQASNGSAARASSKTKQTNSSSAKSDKASPQKQSKPVKKAGNTKTDSARK
ncbi:MAG: hypothetical protein KDC09_04780 [Bacteroidales bacterium]|nr:hypothetical protein [Bacteroidales bacterium]